jgi:hypothetical protein
MDGYRWAVIAHVIGTGALFGGLGGTLGAMAGMWRATTIGQLRRRAAVAGRLEKPLPAGAALLLLSGLYLTVAAWGWGTAWVNVSLAALLAATPLVPAGVAPRLAAIRAAARDAGDGPVPAGLRALARAPALWTSALALAAVSCGILYLMAARPDTRGSLAAPGLALGLGLLPALPLWLRHGRHPGAGAAVDGCLGHSRGR